MPPGRALVLAEGDVHLLAAGRDVEPGEGAALGGGNGHGVEAERAAVEGGGVIEGARRDEEVDVGDACDHLGGRGCVLRWWLG